MRCYSLPLLVERVNGQHQNALVSTVLARRIIVIITARRNKPPRFEAKGSQSIVGILATCSTWSHNLPRIIRLAPLPVDCYTGRGGVHSVSKASLTFKGAHATKQAGGEGRASGQGQAFPEVQRKVTSRGNYNTESLIVRTYGIPVRA